MKTLKIYSVENEIIGQASIYEETKEEIRFLNCSLNKDYIEIEKIDGVRVEDHEGIWHIQYGVQYTSKEISILENGSFYK